MAKHSFSRSVLRGAISSGFTAAAFATATKLSPAQVKSIRAGELELNTRQRRAVKRLTGRTCGQLAALDLEPDGGPFTELMNGWADVADAFAQRPSSPRARARR